VLIAVHCAHQNLVVAHRDHNPGNLLFTPEGRAELLASESPNCLRAGYSPHHTGLDGRPHSADDPRVCQARRRSRQADYTSTDIYSLGVIL